jgi:hypothetical protein
MNIEQFLLWLLYSSHVAALQLVEESSCCTVIGCRNDILICHWLSESQVALVAESELLLAGAVTIPA